MLAKLYEGSGKIYDEKSIAVTDEQKEQEKKIKPDRCSTGMFLLLRQLPLSEHQLVVTDSKVPIAD